MRIERKSTAGKFTWDTPKGVNEILSNLSKKDQKALGKYFGEVLEMVTLSICGAVNLPELSPILLGNLEEGIGQAVESNFALITAVGKNKAILMIAAPRNKPAKIKKGQRRR